MILLKNNIENNYILIELILFLFFSKNDKFINFKVFNNLIPILSLFLFHLVFFILLK